MSSLSKRQLARRRSGRPAVRVQIGLLLIVIAVGLAAFLVGRGSL